MKEKNEISAMYAKELKPKTCSYNDAKTCFIDGFNCGHNMTVNKVCDWLRKNITNYSKATFDDESLIDNTDIDADCLINDLLKIF